MNGSNSISNTTPDQACAELSSVFKVDEQREEELREAHDSWVAWRQAVFSTSESYVRVQRYSQAKAQLQECTSEEARDLLRIANTTYNDVTGRTPCDEFIFLMECAIQADCSVRPVRDPEPPTDE